MLAQGSILALPPGHCDYKVQRVEQLKSNQKKHLRIRLASSSYRMCVTFFSDSEFLGSRLWDSIWRWILVGQLGISLLWSVGLSCGQVCQMTCQIRDSWWEIWIKVDFAKYKEFEAIFMLRNRRTHVIS